MVPAVAFVNEDKVFVPGEVDARIALLAEWLDAGMELGNHTWGHTGLTRTPLPAMQDAVVRGETVTRWLLEKCGYSFVSLDEALSDPAWKSPDGYIGPWGPSRLHRFAAARGEDVKALFRAEPEAPKWIADLDRARREGAPR